jgi:hypothetical protein
MMILLYGERNEEYLRSVQENAAINSCSIDAEKTWTVVKLCTVIRILLGLPARKAEKTLKEVKKEADYDAGKEKRLTGNYLLVQRVCFNS